MTVLTFASLFELLGPREVVYGHLLACAVILVQTRASEMVWSSSYDCFNFSRFLMFTCADPS